LDRLSEVFSRFLEGSALSIGSRQLLDEADVAFGDSAEHGGEFSGHPA
jgi:hypothetical protein